MNFIRNTLILAAASAGLAGISNLPNSPLQIGFISDAEAIIGRPATPVSYAGVARRTTYRAATVAVASTPTTVVVASAPAPATLAVGSVVTVLPAGCETAAIGGVTYQKCGNVYYQAAYQGNNLVYVVSAP